MYISVCAENCGRGWIFGQGLICMFEGFWLMITFSFPLPNQEKSALEMKSGVQLQFTEPASGRRFCCTCFAVSANVVRSLPRVH